MSFKATNIAATTATVANRLITTANMKVGTYTIANGGVAVWQGGFKVSLTHTTVTVTTDTLGTIVVAGKDLHGVTVSETLTPVADSVVLGTTVFKSVTSATGAGWVIDAVEGTADTIVMGVQAGSYVAIGGGMLASVNINTTAAATVVISDASGTIATMKASIAEGNYFFGVPWSGYLKVATTSTNDVTLVHTPGVPSSYAMS